MAPTHTETISAKDTFAAATLAQAYARCRRLNRQHGKSYFLATRLLPAAKRPHVHALYGFTRWADEIVDEMTGATPAQRAARLGAWGEALRVGLAGGPVTDPLLPAVLHTIRSFDLDPGDFEVFLRSMAMDLTVTEYATYADLREYMAGSAAAIGTMMLPILGVRRGGDRDTATESARQLGLAFQLTNFIRDVAEDLARGRVYLPAEDLARFGLDRRALIRDAARGEASAPVRALIEDECRRALAHYRNAEPGLALLEPRSQICIRAAYLLYGGILDQVAAAGYDVLRGRVRVPGRRRAGIILAAPSARRFAAQVDQWRCQP